MVNLRMECSRGLKLEAWSPGETLKLSLSDVKWRNLVSTFHAAKIILHRAPDAIPAINVTCIIAYLMFYILILTA